MTAAMDNDPYGITWRDLIIGVETEAEIHGYTGQEREEGLGLMYYGARFYMPEIGRFMEVDPAREFVNPYSYVGNRPVHSIDPTGNEGIAVLIEFNMLWSNQLLNLILPTPQIMTFGIAFGRRMPISEVIKSAVLKGKFTDDDLKTRFQTFGSAGDFTGLGQGAGFAVSAMVTLGNLENITKGLVYGFAVSTDLKKAKINGASFYITHKGLTDLFKITSSGKGFKRSEVVSILADNLILQVQHSFSGGWSGGIETNYSFQFSDTTTDELFKNIGDAIDDFADSIMEKNWLDPTDGVDDFAQQPYYQ